MLQKEKLSFLSAVIINLNIMLGTGIFINTVVLSKFSGALGSLIYLFTGLLLLPLVLSIASLVRLYPVGGFYSYAKNGLGDFWGFFSAWLYFTGKLASASLMIHVFSLLIKDIIPLCNGFNTIFLDLIILAIFTTLNLKNLSFGTKIQYGFLVTKFIPITFVILFGLFFINPNNVAPNNLIWTSFATSLSIVIYIFTGFESCCSISQLIENPEKNAYRVIITSFIFVVLLISLFQFIFFGVLGKTLALSNSFLDAFPLLVGSIFKDYPLLQFKLINIFHLAIASSVLGCSYSILFSNNWNLYILAKNRHIFFANFFSKLNKNSIPYLCVITEGFICMAYILLTKGNQISLQQTSAFAVTFVYTISTVALLNILYKKFLPLKRRIIPMIALLVCISFVLICFNGLLQYGIKPLVMFIFLVLFGIFMFKLTQFKCHQGQKR